jgi:hypothetical protein
VIEIWLDGSFPPTGRVLAAPGAEPQPFDGWLQLLHILGDAIMPVPEVASEEPPSEPEAALP